MREFLNREDFQQEIDKENKHPLNRAALRALEKTPDYNGPGNELHALELALWAIEARLAKVPDELEQAILRMSGPNPNRAMDLLTHDPDGGKVDLVAEAEKPAKPESLAAAILNHLMSYHRAANPPISNE